MSISLIIVLFSTIVFGGRILYLYFKRRMEKISMEENFNGLHLYDENILKEIKSTYKTRDIVDYYSTLYQIPKHIVYRIIAYGVELEKEHVLIKNSKL